MQFSLDEIKPSSRELPVVFQEADLLVKGSYRWRINLAMPEMRLYVFKHCKSGCAGCEKLCGAGEGLAWGLARIRVNFAAGLN